MTVHEYNNGLYHSLQELISESLYETELENMQENEETEQYQKENRYLDSYEMMLETIN